MGSSKRFLVISGLISTVVFCSLGLSGQAPDSRPRLRPLDELSAGAKTGPAVGAHIPDFEAVDTNGNRRTFDSLKGPRGLVLIFSRSVDWCPYCKTQLADINRQLPRFQRRGLNVAALSYDSVDILRQFAARVGIRYTLLSDPESKAIRAFDILNTNVEKGPHYGIPFPGIYILNERGIVTAKYFDDDYRERSSAASILTREFGEGGVVRGVFENAQIRLIYYASDTVLAPGQRTALVVEVDPKPKMHVYAPGVEHYLPIDWQMNPSKAWVAFPADYPKSHLLELPAIGETVPVYDSHIRVVRDVAIGLEPELMGTLNPDRSINVDGSFRYQACDDHECFLPKTIPLRWTFRVGQLDAQRVPEDFQKK